eukprot:sb/3462007/
MPGVCPPRKKQTHFDVFDFNDDDPFNGIPVKKSFEKSKKGPTTKPPTFKDLSNLGILKTKDQVGNWEQPRSMPWSQFDFPANDIPSSRTAWDPRNNARDPRDSVRDPRDSVRDPRDSVRDPRDSVRDPRDSLRDPRDSVRDPVRDTRFVPRDVPAGIPNMVEPPPAPEKQSGVVGTIEALRDFNKVIAQYDRRNSNPTRRVKQLGEPRIECLESGVVTPRDPPLQDNKRPQLECGEQQRFGENQQQKFGEQQQQRLREQQPQQQPFPGQTEQVPKPDAMVVDDSVEQRVKVVAMATGDVTKPPTKVVAMTTGDATKPPTNAVAMATGDMTKPHTEVLTIRFTKPVVPHASEIAEMELGIGSVRPLSAPLFTTIEKREKLSKPPTPLPTSPLQHAPNPVSSRDVPTPMPLSSRNVCSRSAFTTDWISFIPDILPPCRHVSEKCRKSLTSEQGNMKSGPSPSVRVVKIEKIDPIEVYREPVVTVVKRKDLVKIEKKDVVVRVPGNAARDVGKRKSAVVASQKLAEPEYKELAEYEKEELAASTSRKRKLARPPSPEPVEPEPVVQKQRQGPVQTSTSLKLLIRQTKNRTYIRCHNKDRDPSETSYPVFIITTEDGTYIETDDVDDAWTLISSLIQRIRSQPQQSVLHGLAMWTLAHDGMVNLIEQLPNSYRLEVYSFHFPDFGPQRLHLGRELPEPPGGCARTMPVVRKTYVDQFAFLNHPHRNVKLPEQGPSPYGEVSLYEKRSHGEMPMAMRYRYVASTAREVLCVCPSTIHGRGLYCRQDIPMGEMIIEYSGTLIRPGLCDMKERYYDSKGIGSYMFRVCVCVCVFSTSQHSVPLSCPVMADSRPYLELTSRHMTPHE